MHPMQSDPQPAPNRPEFMWELTNARGVRVTVELRDVGPGGSYLVFYRDGHIFATRHFDGHAAASDAAGRLRLGYLSHGWKARYC
jgi:hypothetical protein